MDRKNYTEIVERYSNNLYKIAISYCKNRYDAEDILQTVFVKLLQADEGFESDEHLKRWLIRVTVNCCKDFCSSFWKRRTMGMDEARNEGEWNFPTSEQSTLYEQVMRLPQKYRLVIHLYYYEEYTVKEIAEILGIKETTVQTQLMRGRKKLESELKEAQYEW
ncbi:MAG: sigma-70 family RNA polymerase sigma factor [Eubacterium sp.]|nr:sigma-70 family RNA polymerase sigma factor [Eubacterium sp.]